MDFRPEQSYLQPPEHQTDIVHVIKGVIEAETGAIEHYNAIIEATDEVDPVTQDMVIGILHDEEGHRRLFEGYLREYGPKGSPRRGSARPRPAGRAAARSRSTPTAPTAAADLVLDRLAGSSVTSSSAPSVSASTVDRHGAERGAPPSAPNAPAARGRSQLACASCRIAARSGWAATVTICGPSSPRLELPSASSPAHVYGHPAVDRRQAPDERLGGRLQQRRPALALEQLSELGDRRQPPLVPARAARRGLRARPRARASARFASRSRGRSSCTSATSGVSPGSAGSR